MKVRRFTFYDASSLTVQSTTMIGDVRVDRRTCLIMDEVDGMSAGDRGGVGALNGLIKKTRVSSPLERLLES